MRKSVIKLLAAAVFVAAIFAAPKKAEAHTSCWVYAMACWGIGGTFVPSGQSNQCWDGQWHMEVICYHSGHSDTMWCEYGGQCEPGCGPDGCDA